MSLHFKEMQLSSAWAMKWACAMHEHCSMLDMIFLLFFNCLIKVWNVDLILIAWPFDIYIWLLHNHTITEHSAYSRPFTGPSCFMHKQAQTFKCFTTETSKKIETASYYLPVEETNASGLLITGSSLVLIDIYIYQLSFWSTFWR